jgi:hypothetical protein
MRWFTETDISVADDEELLSLLAESGCAQLLVGLESPRGQALDGIDTRNWKWSRRKSYLTDIARIQSFGISVNGCFILGHDTDDSTVFEEVRDFVRESGLAEVQITLKTPFPGTTFRAQLEQQGRLLPHVGWSSYTLFEPTYKPARMSLEELTSGFSWLMDELYSDGETARRKAIFRDCVRRRNQAGEP